MLLLLVLVVGAAGNGCGQSPASAPAASGSTTAASSVAARSLTPEQTALLRTLAREGDVQTFEGRYFGTTGSDDAFVAVGTAANHAVAYVCDGTTGAWFVGDVAGDGSMKLEAIAGSGTIEVAAHTPSTAPGAGGPTATIDLGGRRTTSALAPAGASDRLVRIDTAVPAGEGPGTTGTNPSSPGEGPVDVVSGIILRDSGIKGTATVTSPSLTQPATNLQIVGSSPASRLTIQVVPRLPSASSSSSTSAKASTTTTLSPSCQARVIALQTLLGSLQSVRDDYNARITQLTAQAEQFDRLANATPQTPELIGVRQGYEAQARALRSQIQSLQLALADLLVQIANTQVQLAEARRGAGC